MGHPFNRIHSDFSSKNLLLVLLLFCGQFLKAQIPDSLWIKTSTIRFSQPIHKKSSFAVSPPRKLSANEILNLKFSTTSFKNLHPDVPAHFMEENMILRFYIVNDLPIKKEIYFTPGFYYRNMVVYKGQPDSMPTTFKMLDDSATRSKLYPGGRVISLFPGEKAIFYTSFNFIRTNSNNYTPSLVEKDFLKYWIQEQKMRAEPIDMISFVISGILLLMIFYSLAVFLQNKSKEFIYYTLYALCSTVLIFFKSFGNSGSTESYFFYEEYLDFATMVIGVIFYLIFVRSFLNTKEDHKKLDSFLRISEVLLFVLMLVFSGIYFLTDNYLSLFILENYIIKIIMFLVGIVFIVYSIKKKDTLLNYLAAGNIALLFFSMLSLLGMFRIQLFTNPGNIFNNSLFLYELGVALELVFFLSGLAYKNRRDLTERVRERERLKLENERQEFEKQIAIVTTRQEERDRISADMHDELGSGMTAIRLMSEIVKTKMKDQAFPELEKISNSANDLLGKMNSIIWTMKSSNDSLESLVAYLRSNALEYFESTPVVCKVSVPDSVPQIEMSGEKRRNIFLSVKESLNNILKHSHATEMHLDITITKNKLIIHVADNGVGIDTEKLRRFGNGLSNMKRRMESIGGDFQVQSGPGSVIIFTCPL